MSDQYGPHSSGARRLHIGSHPMTETTCDGPQCWCNGGSVPYITTDEELAAHWAGKVKPCEPLLYTQAQVDALLRREIDSEREVWKSRLENAMLQIEGLREHSADLIGSIVDGRAFLPSPPMIIQGVPQFQVDALVAAERERAAKIPQEAAIRLMGGKRRVNQVDTHVSYVLTDIAKQILEGK